MGRSQRRGGVSFHARPGPPAAPAASQRAAHEDAGRVFHVVRERVAGRETEVGYSLRAGSKASIEPVSRISCRSPRERAYATMCSSSVRAMRRRRCAVAVRVDLTSLCVASSVFSAPQPIKSPAPDQQDQKLISGRPSASRSSACMLHRCSASSACRVGAVRSSN